MKYTERLEDLRKDHDLTQEQVAKSLGLKREQYRRYETGINEIKAGFIEKICLFYNVSADYLLGFTNEYKQLPKK
ncbi:MAG: helix-turn-helix domain-containing protein [Acetobacter sp.]|nr:helix-turn-helix domain-containing protein [Bacteroides sp.]MCM1340365.1 helix-turn-helix domain-containing protein [Acetobacter sp.]MCM1432988.1 helix-turn-helix domain-containing protein [Clostridiales bacterium]